MLFGAVSPPSMLDEELTFPDFYSTRLGPCELQDPVWVKMSTVAAGATKKRKKSETKPQAQVNKCNNEKRRREQENIYIEELAELISSNIGDMNSLSVKPDKCTILQETVNQIRSIKAREEAGATSGGASAATTTGGGPPHPQTTDAVQQGEVSSSRPTILANEIIAPLLLEALDGFLFVVTAEGKVEYVTPNIATYIKFTRDEVLSKSIYNIIHHGDHTRFSRALQPLISFTTATTGSTSTTTNIVSRDSSSSSSSSSTTNNPRSRSFYCRFLVKPPEDQDETMEEKQTRINQYEQMHISSTQVPYQAGSGIGVSDCEDGTGDSGPCLLCLARRVPHAEKSPNSTIEQFTTKLDISGKIVAIDTSGVSSSYSAYINKELMGRIIQDLCPPQELHKLTTHLKDTLTTGQATSDIYRLRITTSDKYIRVQTKFKLFKNNPPEQNFIMATHSIIGEHDPPPVLDTNAVDPVMSSVLNGSRNGLPSGRFTGGNSSGANDGTASATSTNNTLAQNTTTTTSYNTFNLDLEFGFPSTTPWGELSEWNNDSSTPRPDSCQSVTPVSTPTPRPPSAPVFSPVPPALTSPFATQPSPSAPNPPTPANNNPFAGSFPFSPITESNFPGDDSTKDTKENVLEEASAMADSARLRNLLTKPPTSTSDSTNDAEVRNKHRILKGLLNQEDDEENRGGGENRTSPRGIAGSRNNNSMIPTSMGSNQTVSCDQPKHANNMLLRLLNEKSDDDDVEHRAGLKKQSELLQQLLKEQDEERKPNEQPQQSNSQDDSLLRSLGFTSSPSPPSGSDMGPGRARKRPSDERDDMHGKRANDSVQVSSSGPSIGNSKLCEKNKMLASLLAKQPSSTPHIPPIPASVISATPQDKLPRVTTNKNNFGGGTLMGTSTASSVVQQQQSSPVVTSQANAAAVEAARQTANVVSRMRMGPGRPATMPQTQAYINQVMDGGPMPMQQAQHIRQPQSSRNQFAQLDANTYGTPAPTTDNSWDIQSSDPLLSDILDSVIDIVPDADSSAILNLLDVIESPQNNNFQQAMNEKMAINAIQKSLMQCETAVKSPSSPISLPGTPPAYSAAMTSTSQQTSQGGFPPPPVYQRSTPGGGGSFQMQQPRAAQTVRQTGGPQYAMAPNQQQQLLLQQRKLLQQQQQQEHKRRLLQQQQQQQLLIPSNASASELNPGLQNIDSLLNNTVAPNVTLQRSSSVPDSQLSPGYAGSIINVNNGSQAQQRHSQQQQQPYSPHSQMTSPLGQQTTAGYPQTTVNNFQQGGARLSPHPPFQQQLSPRQGYPAGGQATQQPTTWSQTQAANRLSLQQQQNPMLNAQLTGNYAGANRGFQVQRQQQPQQQQRTMGSPGAAAATRQSPFPAEAFPTPASPTSGFANQTQYQQQMRLQRTISAPTATTQLPGGLGSPRPYGHHSPYPAPPHAQHPGNPMSNHHHQHAMLYHQQEPQYCYDQSNLQLAYNGADRGRLPPPPPPQGPPQPPPPHLQGGGAGNGMNATSEYVRQELRAVVGARTGQTPATNVRNNQLSGQQVSPNDLEALALNFEMPTSGASDSPKLWGAMGSDMGSMSPQPPTLSSSSRTTTEEIPRPGDQKSSLLQKLLSE